MLQVVESTLCSWAHPSHQEVVVMTYLTSIDLETDPSYVAEAGPQFSLLRLFSPGITDL